MDNKIFNVNGISKEQLRKTLQLIMFDEYDTNKTAQAYSIDPIKGFIIYEYSNISSTNSNCIKFPVPLDANILTDIVYQWLQSEDAKKIKLEEWDSDQVDFDGDTEKGFRVYLEEWGRVKLTNGAEAYGMLCAITPAWMWYGK